MSRLFAIMQQLICIAYFFFSKFLNSIFSFFSFTLSGNNMFELINEQTLFKEKDFSVG